jgi:hypothetical protein
MLRYDIITGEKKEYPECNMNRTWLANDGASFINFAGDDIEIVDPLTCKRKKRIKVSGSYLFAHGTLSLDRSHVFHQTNRDDPNEPNKVVWLITDLRTTPPRSTEISLDYREKEHVFGLNNDILYSSRIRQYNITNGQTKEISNLPLTSLTIYNTSNDIKRRK